MGIRVNEDEVVVELRFKKPVTTDDLHDTFSDMADNLRAAKDVDLEEDLIEA